MSKAGYFTKALNMAMAFEKKCKDAKYATDKTELESLLIEFQNEKENIKKAFAEFAQQLMKKPPELATGGTVRGPGFNVGMDPMPKFSELAPGPNAGKQNRSNNPPMFTFNPMDQIVKTAVVIPTINPAQLEKFQDAWFDIFDNYWVVYIIDGEDPKLQAYFKNVLKAETGLKKYMGKNADLIGNFYAGCRQFGFYWIANELSDTIRNIITLDDDCFPLDNPIKKHLEILGRYTSKTWFAPAVSECGRIYTRGYPYETRKEARIMANMGLWYNVPDLSAIDQLTHGPNPGLYFNRSVIPAGVMAPISGMNFSFIIDALPWIYWAPVHKWPGARQYDDIWFGVSLLKEFDKMQWAVHAGGAEVWHERQSNVYKNLAGQAEGLQYNEKFYQVYDTLAEVELHPFFKEYKTKRERWKNLIQGLV